MGNLTITNRYVRSDSSVLEIDGDSGWINAVNASFSGGLVSSTLNTGQGAYELFAMNQDVESTDAVTFASLDTGQGAYELYDMDQDVDTGAAVTFASVSGDGSGLTNLPGGVASNAGPPLTKIRNSNNNSWTFTSRANIESAVNDLGTDGGLVELPRGIVYLDAQIDMISNVTLRGVGMGKTILRPDSSFNSAYGLIHCRDTHNVTIEQMTLDGNWVYNAITFPLMLIGGTKTDNFPVHATYDLTIDHVEFCNNHGNGIFGYNQVRPRFTNLVAHEIGTKLDVSGSGHQAFGFARAFNGIMENCICYNNSKWTHAYDFAYARNCTVNNIQSVHCGGGMKIDCGTYGWSCNSTFSNLVFTGNIGEISGIGLGVGAGINDCLLQNVVVDGGDVGIYVRSNTQNVTVQNFEIKNINRDSGDQNGYGISIGSASNIKFITGEIKDCEKGAFYTLGSDNITFSHVTFDTFYSANTNTNGENIRFDFCDFFNGMDADSYALGFKNTDSFDVIGCKIKHMNNRGIIIYDTACYNWSIMMCEIADCGNDGIEITNSGHSGFQIGWNRILDCGASTIDDQSTTGDKDVDNNREF